MTMTESIPGDITCLDSETARHECSAYLYITLSKADAALRNANFARVTGNNGTGSNPVPLYTQLNYQNSVADNYCDCDALVWRHANELSTGRHDAYRRARRIVALRHSGRSRRRENVSSAIRNCLTWANVFACQ